jgi:hypothetical protein
MSDTDTAPSSLTFSTRILGDKDPRGPKGSRTPVEEPIVIPADFAVLHELEFGRRNAKQAQHLHIAAASMALCCPRMERMLARKTPPLTYEAHGFDPIKFGRAVYNWLIGQGAQISEISKAGQVLAPLITVAGFATDEAVGAALGKSPGPEAG